MALPLEPSPSLPHEAVTVGSPEYPDIVVLAHLRWNFVFQRPQHLFSRAAHDRRVFYVEEPIYSSRPERYLVRRVQDRLWVVVPVLPPGLSEAERMAPIGERLDELIATYHIENYVLWYYAPMGVPASRHLQPIAVVYDCMDELSTFRKARDAVVQYES